jgi:hypothetical protein
MANLYGIYAAKVIDNIDPENQGRILVHIYKRDGTLNYSKQNHTWVPVLSSYGGNREMGMYMLPPIHSEGYVIFEEGDPKQPVWIGSYPFSVLYSVDEEATEQAGVTIFKSEPSIPPEMASDPTRAIIKTQYSSLKNPEVDNDENVVENLIVMDESKLELNHINPDHYIYKKSGIDDSFARSYLKLENNSITMGVRSGDDSVHEISITSAGITLTTNDGANISMTEGGIQINGSNLSETKITMKTPGPIEINGKKVLVDGENIIVGPIGDNGGGGAVTSDVICPFAGFNCMAGSSKTIIGG